MRLTVFGVLAFPVLWSCFHYNQKECEYKRAENKISELADPYKAPKPHSPNLKILIGKNVLLKVNTYQFMRGEFMVPTLQKHPSIEGTFYNCSKQNLV